MLRRAWRWVRSHPMGRRGLIQHLKGWAWTCYGIAFVTDSVQGPFAHPGGITVGRIALELPDSNVYGWLWIACGTFSALCAAAAAVIPRDVHRVVTVGWALSIIPPIVWSSIYAWTWMIHQLTACPINPGWLGLAGFWAFVALIVRVLSGWDEPVRLPHHEASGYQIGDR